MSENSKAKPRGTQGSMAPGAGRPVPRAPHEPVLPRTEKHTHLILGESLCPLFSSDSSGNSSSVLGPRNLVKMAPGLS